MSQAEQMVKLLTDALSTNAAVAEVVIDGTTVRYDRAQALKELEFWTLRADREANRRPLSRGVNIRNAW